MWKLLFLIIFIICPFFINVPLHSQMPQVFAVVRHYLSEHDLKVKTKKKVNEFLGDREYLRYDDQLKDSILSLTMPSDIYYSEFYITNWDDGYNLLIERCIGSKDCNKFVVHHYSKSLKGLHSKHLKEKHIKIDFNEYHLGVGECADLFRVTIEKEELVEITYPEGYTPEGETRYTENKSEIKKFYVYLCD